MSVGEGYVSVFRRCEGPMEDDAELEARWTLPCTVFESLGKYGNMGFPLSRAGRFF